MSGLALADPALQQQAFRAVLDAFARPGDCIPASRLGAPPLLAFLATVLDESVRLADPHRLIDERTRRLLLAPSAPVAEAQFVLFDARRAPGADDEPCRGTLEAPELGATAVLYLDALADGAAARGPGSFVLRLAGPGVCGERRIAVAGLAPDWIERRNRWVERFPLGVDVVLAAPTALAALPRTTRVEVFAIRST